MDEAMEVNTLEDVDVTDITINWDSLEQILNIKNLFCDLCGKLNDLQSKSSNLEDQLLNVGEERFTCLECLCGSVVLENSNALAGSSNVTAPAIATVSNLHRSSAVVKPKKPIKMSKLNKLAEKVIQVVEGKSMSEFEHFCSAIAIKMQKISDVNPRIAVHLQVELDKIAEKKMLK